LLVQVDDLLERERRFIADAAHELRTPLAILRVHAQNAQSAGTEEQRREALDFLVNGVGRATRIGSQLLTMARIGGGAGFGFGSGAALCGGCGPGIDEGEIGRLFERFYSRGNANGAGLAIVQVIVGKIGVV
jgi:signal transduction histidine kinase